MSELKEKILGPSNIRSQAIKVIILSVILITAFAFSVSILTFVFGSVRNKPSERKSDADFDDPVLVEIPIPFDIDDLMDLFEDLDLTPEELQELLETLMEMYDGDFDDIPLEDLAALMAAMMFSDVEAFRVYDYPSVTEIEDYLWKYECFDQYSQGSWSASDPSLDTISFHTYAEYASNPDLTDLLTVKMLNLSANAGINQFTIPTLFSSPFLIENSVSATALDNSSVTIHSQTDGLNGSALRASFTSSVDTNLTYQLAGDDLPDATEINDSCALVTSPSTEYNQMLSDYQQMDGQNIMDYMNQTHMADFKALFDYLNSYVISPGDNAFIIANKIRNYLQYNFVLNYSPMPGTEQDRINWFCASGEGLYSDFASVFCALTRAFGVPSRFVDGFNTRFVSESLDPFEGTMTIPILYRNIYSWAEIFVPTSNDGSGNWTQFDVYFENFGGIPPIPPYVNSTFKLVVECDGSSYPPDYALVNRDDFVNVTAILMNGSTPVPNEVITFSDYVTGMTLGTNTTNSQGAATIFVEANISFTVGPNLIMGKYSPQVIGGSFIVIDDIMTVNLNYVNPTEINVSDVSNSTFTVSGNVTDPNNGRGVPYSNVEFLLYFNNTSTLVSNPFTPGTITADVNGEFSGVLTASSSIYRGPYDLVANVSGSANYTIPSFPYPLQIPLLGYGYAPGNSSQRRDVFIDKVGGKIIYFYINDVPSTDPSLSPIVSRGSTLTLKARVLNETGGDLDGIPVTFYDYTRGDQPINTNATVNGWTTIEYDAGSSAIVGPNLLYARTGFQSNYSYFILNDTVDITLSSGPSPRVVNVSVLGQNRFTITGYLNDNNNSLPLNRSYLMLRMFRSSIDYTAYLTGNPIPINGDGSFNSMFYVNPSISPGNYTLRLDFNGSFDFWNNNPNNPHYFDLPYINGSLDVPNQLQITNFSPIQLDFWIDDFPNYDYLNPVINRYQNVNLSARLSQGGLPLNGLQVHFYDITNGTYIGSNVTDSNGYAWFVYDTGFNTVAGPHLIRALYGSSYDNYSFFVLDDEINVSFDSGPVPSWVYDNHPSQATFHIMGTLYDAKNGRSILGGVVETVLVEGIDSYLTNAGGGQQYNNYFVTNQTGIINAYYNITPGTPYQNYTLRLDFYGLFYYNGSVYDYNSFINFTTSAIGNQIEVRDYDNVTISLFVDSYQVPYSYPDTNLPAIVRLGENITFSGRVYQSGIAADGATVYLYDYYTDPSNPIATTIADGSGNYVFEINTSTSSLHAGLHLMRVRFNAGTGIFPTFNSTYIVINETISSFTITSTDSGIVRNVEGFTVYGTLQDGGNALRGLEVRIRLYDQSLIDHSQYLIFEPGYSITTITDDAGYYEFDINRVNISCLQGNYNLRVEFTGSIYRSDVPISIGMPSAMVSTQSIDVSLDVYASTMIIEDSYWASFEDPPYDDNWVLNTTLYVNGTLLWDNGSAISGVTLTIRVQYLNGTLISENSTNLTVGSGYFIGSLLVESNWPDDRDQTEIWVMYFPSYPYVISDQIEYTDW